MIKKISKAGMAIALGISLLALNTNSVNAKVENGSNVEKVILKDDMKATATDVEVNSSENNIQKEIKNIKVDTEALTLNPGETKQLVVIANMADGSMKDITSGSYGTTYESDSISVAKVNGDGLITVPSTAKAGYLARLTIKNNGKITYCDVTVGDPIPRAKSITVNPTEMTLNPGETKQLVVTGSMNDGTTKDISNGSNGTTYELDSPSIAKIDANGLIKVTNDISKIGYVGRITVKNNGKVAYCTLTVGDPIPRAQSITVNPTEITLNPGETKQLVVTGNMNDGTMKDITNSSNGTTYEINSTAIGKIDANGLIKVTDDISRIGYVGKVTIKNNGRVAYCNVTIGDPIPRAQSITVNPTEITLNPGETKQLVVTGNMNDGTMKDITNSSNGTTYEINSIAIGKIDANGLIKVTDDISKIGYVGKVTIKNNGRVAYCNVTVGNPVKKIKSINIKPSKITLKPGETGLLNVIATMSDGTTIDITKDAKDWTTSDKTIAFVDDIGVVTGREKGEATIQVVVKGYEDFPAECQVTVVDNKEQNGVLNIEPEKDKIKFNEVVTANLVMDNIENIAAEDVVIKYDSEKLKFVDMKEVDGIKLVKNDIKAGELRCILASNGKNNIVNAKKTLLKLNFQGIKRGEALVDIVKGRVSDGIESEYSLEEKQCGQATIIIDDMADVNNSGEFTLLDLAIDARHLGEDPTTLKQYNTDIEVNGAIDDADLLEIANQMLLNPNYKL